MNSNKYMSDYMNNRYVIKKLKAIEYKGGKCIECGYNKCPAALTFHHRDQDSKEFEWKNMRNRTWSVVLKELDKCDLLCCRCHTELHYDPQIVIRAKNWAKTIEESKIPKYEINGICPCGKSFVRNHGTSNKKYCSQECFRTSQSNYPSDHEFIKMVDAIGKLQTSRNFGVSFAAISKRYKRLTTNA